MALDYPYISPEYNVLLCEKQMDSSKLNISSILSVSIPPPSSSAADKTNTAATSNVHTVGVMRGRHGIYSKASGANMAGSEAHTPTYDEPVARETGLDVTPDKKRSRPDALGGRSRAPKQLRVSAVSSGRLFADKDSTIRLQAQLLTKDSEMLIWLDNQLVRVDYSYFSTTVAYK